MTEKVATENGEDFERGDINGDESRALIRFAARHKGVQPVIERKMWEIKDLLAISDKMDANQKRELLRIEQEKERKRKMSAPYGSTVDMTDGQWSERSRRLSSVHEDLLRVFSVQSAMAQQQHELQRRLAQANKELMHEELLKKSVQKAVGEAVEVERQRRIKILKEMAEGKGDSTYEIADTNAKLSKVHSELKETFQYIWDENEALEKKRLELNNETKRMIRRAAGRRFSLQLEKLIQQKKVHEENLKITDEYYQIVKGKMKEVQKELANVFEGFRRKMEVFRPKAADPIAGQNQGKAGTSKNTKGDSEVSKGVTDHVKLERIKRAEAKERDRRMSLNCNHDAVAEKLKVVDSYILIHKEMKQKQDRRGTI